jgi:hypothetical protein
MCHASGMDFLLAIGIAAYSILFPEVLKRDLSKTLSLVEQAIKLR